MDETKEELLQPVCKSNPLVYMDISIGKENGKRKHTQSVLDLVRLRCAYVCLCVNVY